MKSIITGALAFSLMLGSSIPGQAKTSANLTNLADTLNTWLDAQTEYENPAAQPRIILVSPSQAAYLHGAADHSGGTLRGLYDDETETIYLVEPWSANDTRDVSVLVHELVHHRQSEQHWYCPQAQEWRAYQIQSQWLQEKQIEDDFYWPAIVLKSSCAKRDIHPE